MYRSFGGFDKRKERLRKKEQEQEQAKLENQKMEEAKVSEDNKKIYLIAGVVAVLGAVIIIIKTRKK